MYISQSLNSKEYVSFDDIKISNLIMQAKNCKIDYFITLNIMKLYTTYTTVYWLNFSMNCATAATTEQQIIIITTQTSIFNNDDNILITMIEIIMKCIILRILLLLALCCSLRQQKKCFYHWSWLITKSAKFLKSYES